MFDYQKPQLLLSSCPVYRATPLTTINYQNQVLQLKVESTRMGLGSFKALGGIYAVARLIEEQCGVSITPDNFMSDDLNRLASKLTFVCASAGNHGLAVATGAKLFGAKARVYLPETAPASFTERLKEKNAEVIIAGATYEDSMLLAQQEAEQADHIFLSDSSWPDYRHIPQLVMEGYTVIATELKTTYYNTDDWPSHVFLQAGVGGFAAAMTWMIRTTWLKQPEIIIVEPEHAACLKQSIDNNQLTAVQGEVSIMGRLDCKEASLIAYEILNNHVEHCVTISDEDAIAAVTTLKDLSGIESTPSGAAGFAAMMNYPDSLPMPLCIITEGDLLE